MQTYDLTPLFRTSIGFDRMSRLFETAMSSPSPSYPPYNIVKLGENDYRITVAVAGFREGDLEIVSHQNTLTIRGRRTDDAAGVEYLHRGIAGRAFERRFHLADYVRVGNADLRDGLLHVELTREVPEAMRPRTIAIHGALSAPPAEAK